MGSKIKHNWRLSRPEAADLLRKLADALEEGADELGPYGLSFAELVKFKIKIDLDEEDSLEVKFSGKGFKLCGSPTPCGSAEAEETAESRERRMQIYFRTLQDSVSKGEAPSREIVSVFLSDVKKMCACQDAPESEWPEWERLCQRLRMAEDSENLAEMDSILTDLARLSAIHLSER